MRDTANSRLCNVHWAKAPKHGFIARAHAVSIPDRRTSGKQRLTALRLSPPWL
jgi:hypothetical protein